MNRPGAFAKAAPTNIPALTGIRGICAWWVVLQHVVARIPVGPDSTVRAILGHGFLAVDLFFVLSGFVIYLNYADRVVAASGHAVGKFLLLRWGRIYPVHFCVLLIFLLNPIAISLFSHAHTTGPRYDPSYFFMSLALVQNWGFTSGLAWNIPSWSISTEAFAYLIFPVIAWNLQRRRWPVTAPLAVTIAALAALGASFYISGCKSLGEDIESLGLLRCVLEFTAGCGLCCIWTNHRKTIDRFAILSFSFGMSLLVYVIVSGAPDYMIAPCAFSCIILGLAGGGSTLNAMFASRGILFLGEISYSTYMIHYFIKDWVGFSMGSEELRSLFSILVYIVATFLASVFLNRFVEEPGRRWSHRMLRKLDTAAVTREIGGRS